MGKIGRAVERIHIPPELTAGIAQSLFLAQNVVSRPGLPDALAN